MAKRIKNLLSGIDRLLDSDDRYTHAWGFIAVGVAVVIGIGIYTISPHRSPWWVGPFFVVGVISVGLGLVLIFAPMAWSPRARGRGRAIANHLGGLIRRHAVLSCIFGLAIVALVVVLSTRPWSSGYQSSLPPGDVPLPRATVQDSGPLTQGSDGLEEQLGVGNVTAGATAYQSSTTMSYDQVVKIELSFFNPTLYPIYGVVPQVTIPTTGGINQTVGVRLSDGSGVSLDETIPITLDDPRGILQFEPHSVQWGHVLGGRYGKAVVTALPDRVLENGASIQNLSAHSAGTLAFLVREVIPGIEVSTRGHGQNNSQWSPSFYAPPSSKVTFQITVRDDGDTPITELFIGDRLPGGARYVKGSARVTYSGSNSLKDAGQLLPPEIIEAVGGELDIGAPLPAIPAGGYWASLLNGRSASLLPGETAIVTLSAVLNGQVTPPGTVTNHVDVRWAGNAVPITQSQTLNVSNP